MIDFIIKLSLLKESITNVKYDLILIIINRLTKYTYFILYLENLSVEDLIYIFVKYITGNYRILKEIINNKDKFFTSKF